MTSPYQWKDGDWRQPVFGCLKDNGVSLVAHVPDAGHTPLISAAEADPDMTSVVLTTEEEGVALLSGADLGGVNGVMLMQSSGVGNCLNMFSLLTNCGFPFLTLVTMRGEWAEFNPWQIAAGRGTPAMFELAGFTVLRATTPDEAAQMTAAGARLAFDCDHKVAVLFSQRLIGAKVF